MAWTEAARQAAAATRAAHKAITAGRTTVRPTMTKIANAAVSQFATWKATDGSKIPKDAFGRQMTKTKFIKHTVAAFKKKP